MLVMIPILQIEALPVIRRPSCSSTRLKLSACGWSFRGMDQAMRGAVEHKHRGLRCCVVGQDRGDKKVLIVIVVQCEVEECKCGGGGMRLIAYSINNFQH